MQCLLVDVEVQTFLINQYLQHLRHLMQLNLQSVQDRIVSSLVMLGIICFVH